jgi:hypothetical protein
MWSLRCRPTEYSSVFNFLAELFGIEINPDPHCDNIPDRILIKTSAGTKHWFLVVC